MQNPQEASRISLRWQLANLQVGLIERRARHDSTKRIAAALAASKEEPANGRR